MSFLKWYISIYTYIHGYLWQSPQQKPDIIDIMCFLFFVYRQNIVFSFVWPSTRNTWSPFETMSNHNDYSMYSAIYSREMLGFFCNLNAIEIGSKWKKSVKRVWMTHRHICVLIFPNTWFSAIYIYIVWISQILKANKVILNSKQRITILWFYNWYERSAWKIPAMTNWLNICCGEGPIFIAVLTNRTHKQTSYHD